MPFILPYQRTKISNSTLFSKYKNVDESSFFLLQKLKSTFRSADSPTYRIITQHHPYYEVANGMDLPELRENWDYLVNKLPSILPTQLPPKLRQAWFIAHFTQLALETAGPHLSDDTAASYPFNISLDDEDDEDHKHSTGVPLADSSSLSSFSFGSPSNLVSSPHAVASAIGASATASLPLSSLNVNSNTGNNNNGVNTGSSHGSPVGPSSGSSTPMHAHTHVATSATTSGINASNIASSTTPHANVAAIRRTAQAPPLYSLSNDETSGDHQARSSHHSVIHRDMWPQKNALPRRDATSARDTRNKRRSLRISSLSSVTTSSSSSGTIGNNGTISAAAAATVSSLPAIHELRGGYVWSVLCVFTNIVWLLLRDARWEIFLIALLGVNVVLYLLLVRGRPCTIGVLFLNTETLSRASDAMSPIASSSTSPRLSSIPKSTSSVSSSVPLSRSGSDDDGESDSRGSDIDLAPIMRAVHRKTATSSTALPSSTSSSLSSRSVSSLASSSSSTSPSTRSSSLTSRVSLPDSTLSSPSFSSRHIAPATATPAAASVAVTPRDIAVRTTAMTFSLINNKLPAGITLTRAANGGNTWYPLDGTTFQVRCGPNYKRNKTKKNSQTAMYEFIGADCFTTPNGKQLHIMQQLSLPSPGSTSSLCSASLPSSSVASIIAARTSSDNKERKTRASDADDTLTSSSGNGDATIPLANATGLPAGIAPYFVVNLMLPAYAPSNPVWGATVEDGVGYSLVLYFAMTERTKELMISAKPTASVALLRRFLSAHPRGDEIDELRRRLKCIPRLANVDEVNLGITKTLVNNYNAKPFMTGPRCHTFHKGSDYLEVDVDIHRFSYLARKGAWSMWDSLPDMALDIGLVVEARGEEEMPEQVLGVARVNKLQANTRSIAEWRALATGATGTSLPSSSASSTSSGGSSSISSSMVSPSSAGVISQPIGSGSNATLINSSLPSSSSSSTLSVSTMISSTNSQSSINGASSSSPMRATSR